MLTTHPITPVLGAEIIGADLTRTDAAEAAAILDALNQFEVLVFRDQPELTPAQQIAFARQFGPLHTHPAAPHFEGLPELFVIHAHAESKVANGNGWHTDVSCDTEPPMATMLQIHTRPECGGDTLFASMTAAYATLSEPLQQFLCTLTAVHASEHIYRGRYSDRGVDDAGREYPSAVHPVVRTHLPTGKQSLFVNPSFTTHIEGLSAHESTALLRLLYRHQQRPELQCRIQWADNTIVLWDNRTTQHFALWDYWPAERKGHRVTIAGDKPVYTPGAGRKLRMRLSRQQL